MKKNSKSGKTTIKGGKKMLVKAELAMKNEFYLEASWIISAILEKRLKKILEKVEPQKPGLSNTFDQNIKRIKHLRLTSNQMLLTEHFGIPMIDALRIWKNQRNEVMKDMLVRHITKDRLERLAGDGSRMLKEWDGCVKAFKKDFKKRIVLPATTT